MRKNKKLVKRIGCGLLAGTLAFSGVMPFSGSSVAEAASAGLVQWDDTLDKYVVNADEHHLTYVEEGNIYYGKTAYSYYEKSIKEITDGLGNTYSGDVVKIAYQFPQGAFSPMVLKYCIVNLKHTGTTNAAVKKAEVPRTVSTTIDGKTVDLPVIELGEKAFKDSTLESISLPDTIVKISDFAFYNAQNLKEVTFTNEKDNTTNFGENLVELGSYAFAKCTNLTNACIPAQLIEAEVDDNGDFVANTYKTDYKGCDGKFGTDVFRDCTSLKTIVIGNSNSKNIEIPDNTFAGCQNLETISFEDNIKKALIGQAAFSGCSIGLKNLTINCDLVLEPYAFADNTNLTTVMLNGNVEESAYAENGAQGLFTKSFLNNEGSITFGEKTKNIVFPKNCFEQTGKLNNIVYSEKVENITVDAFAFKNTGLKEINLGGASTFVKRQGLAGLGTTTKSVIFNSKKTLLQPECFTEFEDTSSTTVLDNLSLSKIMFNSQEVSFGQYYYLSTPVKNIFTGVGKNCSLYFGKNVETIDGTVEDFQPKNAGKYKFYLRQGLGNIKSVYITNPKTKLGTGIAGDYRSHGFICDNDCTVYGFEGTDIYDNISSGSYTKLKAAPYIKDIFVENLEVIEFVSNDTFEDTFDATKIKLKAELADNDTVTLEYSKDGTTNGYTIPDASKKALEDAIKGVTTSNNNEQEVTINFEYANKLTRKTVKIVPKKVADFTVSLKNNISFVEGTTIDKSAFEITDVIYNDGRKETIAANPEDITVKLASGSDKLTKDKNIVKVSYQGTTKDFEITAIAKSITKLTAKLKSTAKTYCAGSQLTSDDFIVAAEYNNGDKEENFKDFTVNTNIIPNTVTAGTPYVVKISSGDVSVDIAIDISTPKIKDLIVSYTGAGVLEGDSVDKNNIKVTALYDNLTTTDLKPEEYMLVYEPIVADVRNQVKVVYLADTSIIGTFEVTGLKRTQYDPTAGPVATPTLLPTAVVSSTPTVVPTITPVVSNIPAPTFDVPVVATSTPVPATEQPTQTVSPDVVPNTGVTKLKANKYTLGLKEKVTVSLTGGKATAFVSSNSNVATVSSKGVVKAKKVGSTTVYVTDEFGKTKSVKITVKKAPKTVKASVKKKTLKVGKKFTIKAKFTKGYYSNKITFTSSNKKVATVNKNGVILAKKKGKTTITLKTYNGKKVKITVTVK